MNFSASTGNLTPNALHMLYMQRCIDLAESALGFVAPNPMVGAVLAYEDKIIGEGFHEHFGDAHAEVNAVRDAIAKGNEQLLSSSTLYVSLEPCAHHGKTPPCTELIIRHRIPRVVIGCRDPFDDVNGKGIETLLNAGIEVTTGVMENECRMLNRRFITFHERKRPYIIIKFAKTADGFIAPLTGDGKISNRYSDILVHKWRSEEQAIMVGTGTAAKDDPRLTVRHWTGLNPLRVIIDKNLSLPSTNNIFDDAAPTLIVNSVMRKQEGNVEFTTTTFEDLPAELNRLLFERNILSVIIEGGSNLISQFTGTNVWDEARIITSKKVFGAGLSAPQLNGNVRQRIQIGDDEIHFIENPENNFEWNY